VELADRLQASERAAAVLAESSSEEARRLQSAVRRQSELAGKFSHALSQVRSEYLSQGVASRWAASFPWFLGKKARRHARLLERSGIFNAEYYKSQLPAGFHVKSPALHYARIGWKCGLAPHLLFDGIWYARTYGIEGDPFADYLEHGWKAGRHPHPLFDSTWYVKQYPDVLKRGRNPLVDYLKGGEGQRRWPNPQFDGEKYIAEHSHQLAPGQTPLAHFVEHGGASLG
jgi:hypothetical protein